MKYLKYMFLFVCTYGIAQIQTPQSSPLAKVEQEIGLTQVTIE